MTREKARTTQKEKEKKFKEKLTGDAHLTGEELIETIASEIKKRKEPASKNQQKGRSL